MPINRGVDERAKIVTRMRDNRKGDVASPPRVAKGDERLLGFGASVNDVIEMLPVDIDCLEARLAEKVHLRL